MWCGSQSSLFRAGDMILLQGVLSIQQNEKFLPNQKKPVKFFSRLYSVCTQITFENRRAAPLLVMQKFDKPLRSNPVNLTPVAYYSQSSALDQHLTSNVISTQYKLFCK